MRRSVVLLASFSVVFLSCATARHESKGSRSPASISESTPIDATTLSEKAARFGLPPIPDSLHGGDPRAAQVIADAIEAYGFMLRNEQIFGSLVVRKLRIAIPTTSVKTLIATGQNGAEFLIARVGGKDILMDPLQIEKMAPAERLASAVHVYLGVLDEDHKNSLLFKRLYEERLQPRKQEPAPERADAS
jgi:hypothetical protein